MRGGEETKAGGLVVTLVVFILVQLSEMFDW